MEDRSRTVSYRELEGFVRDILSGLGYSSDQAELTAWVLAQGDARGVTSHGVARLPFYAQNLDGGFANPSAALEVVHETPISLTLDGHHGIGPAIAREAMTRVLEKARVSGAGFASVRNSNHFGMAGLWAEMASSEGLIGMAFCNTRRCSVPTFGRERILGTNPISVAFPSASGQGFLLDMATTAVAHGKVELHQRRAIPMPLGWVVDETGAGTTDAAAFKDLFESDRPGGGHLFLGGEGVEAGGHKGFGLGLLVELLTAGLSMGRLSRDTFTGEGSGISQFFGAMRPDLFGDGEAITRHVDSLLDEVRRSPTAAGQERIFIHGDKEREAEERAMKDGIFLDGATVEMMNGFAERLGLSHRLRP